MQSRVNRLKEQLASCINNTLLKEHLRRFWPIAFLALLGYILVIIVPLYSMEHSSWQVNQLVDLLSMQNMFMLIAAVAVPFCAAMALYPYYFNGPAATGFHSLPLNKKQLLCTGMLAGLILILLPVFLLSLALLVPIRFFDPNVLAAADSTFRAGGMTHFPAVLLPNGISHGAVVNSIPVVMGFFARTAVAFTFYWVLFSLAASVSGNRVVAALLCGAFPLIPVALYALWELSAIMYVFGYVAADNQNIFGAILAYTNPLGWFRPFAFAHRFHFADGVPPGMARSLFPYFISYILITLALGALTYYCAHRRPLERTGDSVVFGPLKNVLIFMVSLAGMIPMGALLFALAPGGMFALYGGMVLGFSLAYCIAQMIAEKSFRIGHKLKYIFSFGGVMGALFGLMLFITQVAALPFVYRMPALEDVKAVSFAHQWGWVNMETAPHMFHTDRALIAETRVVHQEILDNRRKLRRVFWESQLNWGGFTEQPITYVLQDGRHISRMYMLPNEFVRESGLLEVLTAETVILRENPILARVDEILMVQINVDVWGDDWALRHDQEINLFNTISDIPSFMAAVRQDALAQSRAWLENRINNEWVRIRRQGDAALNLSFAVSDLPVNERWRHSLFLDYAPHTVAWLRTHGYLE